MALRRIQPPESFRFHRRRHSPNRHHPSRRQIQSPDLFSQDDFLRNYLRYLVFSGLNDPLGDRPRIGDPQIVSWYPLCPYPEALSDRLGLGQGQGEKRDVSHVPGDQKPQLPDFVVCLCSRYVTLSSWFPLAFRNSQRNAS